MANSAAPSFRALINRVASARAGLTLLVQALGPLNCRSWLDRSALARWSRPLRPLILGQRVVMLMAFACTSVIITLACRHPALGGGPNLRSLRRPGPTRAASCGCAGAGCHRGSLWHHVLPRIRGPNLPRESGAPASAPSAIACVPFVLSRGGGPESQRPLDHRNGQQGRLDRGVRPLISIE